MASTIRVLVHGLVGLDFEGFKPEAGTATGLVVLCLTPRLVAHVPKLRVHKDLVNTTDTTLPGQTTGSFMEFSVGGFNLTLSNAAEKGLDVAEQFLDDPFDSAFELHGISNLPASVELAGFSEVEPSFVWPALKADLATAMLLRDGRVRSRKRDDDEFSEWRFEDGKWRLNRPAADELVCDITVKDLPKVVAQPRTGGDSLFVVFNQATQLTVELTHECIGAGCTGVKGKHFPQLYEMLPRTLRKPVAKAIGFTDGSYCPPLRFWR